MFPTTVSSLQHHRRRRRMTLPRQQGIGPGCLKPVRLTCLGKATPPGENAGAPSTCHVQITPVPYRIEKTNHTRSRNWSASWILPLWAGRFRLGYGL